jgi:homocysteine S-methyltransferase
MQPNPLQPFLSEAGVVILDGALATELERRGADLHDPLWSAKVLLEQPALIRQVHFDYFAAGADVAITASYQATFAGFAQRGLAFDQAADLMRCSVQLAQAACADYWHTVGQAPTSTSGRQKLKPLVAASIGPYGAYLADGSEYRGDYGLSVAELRDFHRPRLKVLVEAGADLLACETIPCLAEAEALVQVLAEFPQTVAWLSFSCSDGTHICHGEPLAEGAALADRAEQIVAVGVNCTPPRFVESLLRRAATVTAKPLVAYPNSGERWEAVTNCWLPGSGVTEFGEPARHWYAAGARLVGGCCRTTPADIHTIALALRTSAPPAR